MSTYSDVEFEPGNPGSEAIYCFRVDDQSISFLTPSSYTVTYDANSQEMQRIAPKLGDVYSCPDLSVVDDLSDIARVCLEYNFGYNDPDVGEPFELYEINPITKDDEQQCWELCLCNKTAESHTVLLATNMSLVGKCLEFLRQDHFITLTCVPHEKVLERHQISRVRLETFSQASQGTNGVPCPSALSSAPLMTTTLAATTAPQRPLTRRVPETFTPDYWMSAARNKASAEPSGAPQPAPEPSPDQPLPTCTILATEHAPAGLMICTYSSRYTLEFTSSSGVIVNARRTAKKPWIKLREVYVVPETSPRAATNPQLTPGFFADFLEETLENFRYTDAHSSHKTFEITQLTSSKPTYCKEEYKTTLYTPTNRIATDYTLRQCFLGPVLLYLVDSAPVRVTINLTNKQITSITSLTS